MAHDPRVFVGQQADPQGNGHQLHLFSASCPQLPAILAVAASSGLRELTSAEYTAWDSGDRRWKDVEAHGR